MYASEEVEWGEEDEELIRASGGWTFKFKM